LLLAFASTVIICFGRCRDRWPLFSFQDIYMFLNGPSSTRRATVLSVILLSRAVICCWPSSAQLFLVSGPVGTHNHIFVFFPRHLIVLKRDSSSIKGGVSLCGHYSERSISLLPALATYRLSSLSNAYLHKWRTSWEPSIHRQHYTHLREGQSAEQ
jgi:hypothetical protein